METVEIVAKVIGLILSCAALITLVTKVVKKCREIIEYKNEIANIKTEIKELKTNTTFQFQSVMDEQIIQIKAINAVLDGLQQLGCNHTVPDAKLDLDNYLIKQSHRVEKL